jgi:hypothetical protein
MCAQTFHWADAMTDPCHDHNRSRPRVAERKPWGLRLSLPEQDPMRRLLGDDWHEYQWFATEEDREAKLDQLCGQFIYYRKGDKPGFVVERVNREDAGGA